MDFVSGSDFGERSDSVFGGDFYHQEDNHTRSGVLSVIPDAFGGSLPGELIRERDAEHKRTVLHSGYGSAHLWFKEGGSAPALPFDTLFSLEATTVFLGDDGGSADGIGNRLLAYFDAETTVTVSKVSPAKFAFKSKVECQGFNCEVKVRMYRQGAGHVVEFQRRDGDAFLFTSIYQRAAAQLKPTLDLHTAPFAGKGTADAELVILPPLQLFQGMHGFGHQPELPLAFGVVTGHPDELTEIFV